MQLSTDRLRFALLPSSNPPADLLYLHNNVYRLWKDVWLETFAKLGLDPGRLDGEFGRQNLIACIADGDKPLAIHLYSFYAVDALASREHPYLRDNYPDLYFLKLQAEGVRTVMSMEYMTVHPEYRKGSSNVHLGIVLVGLAHYTMREFFADAAIAPARRDRKVNELAFSFGGEAVIENVMNHNVACDLVMTRREKVRPLEHAPTQTLLDRLWQQRIYVPAIEPEKASNGGEVIKLPALKRAA